MFENLFQNYSLKQTVQQKQALFKQTLNQLKQAKLPDLLQHLHNNFNKFFQAAKNHPQYTAQFVFQNLSIQDLLCLMKIQTSQQLNQKQSSILRLLSHIGKSMNQQQNQNYIEWFCKMYTRYSSLQKALIFMVQLVQNYVQKLKDQYLPQFLADFINGSSLVVQSYLKLKAQSPKFDIDYMQHGQVIVKNTQSWLKNLYIKMFKKLKALPQNIPIKTAILNGVCDIVGALLQIQREGSIQSSICDNILQQCFQYIKKLTSIDQFNNLYLYKLKSNNFNIFHHKITIPICYPSTHITFPKQSYGYLMFRFVKDSLAVYSQQYATNYLIPIMNELSQFQYQIKKQIQQIFVKNIASGKVCFRTCYQGNFPLSILYFNLWHYQLKRNQNLLAQFDKIYQSIRKINPKSYVNNLKILSNYHVQNLQNQINQFIGEKALVLSEKKPQQLVSLLKNMKWDNINQKGQKVWTQIITNLCKKNQVKSDLQRFIKGKQLKSPFQKQISKLILN